MFKRRLKDSKARCRLKQVEICESEQAFLTHIIIQCYIF